MDSQWVTDLAYMFGSPKFAMFVVQAIVIFAICLISTIPTLLIIRVLECVSHK